MNAICAEPAVGVEVAHLWTSATKLPTVDSAPRLSSLAVWVLPRENGPAILPSSTAPSTLALATAASTIAWVGPSGA
jgi:hypothetical protein